MKYFLFALLVPLFVSGDILAACPSADLTGDDCIVDLQDLAIMASQWLTEGDPLPVLNGMTWVSISDSGIAGHETFIGEMGKYEITNAQYCQFLNEAITSGDITVDTDNWVYGATGSNSGADFVGEGYFQLYPGRAESQITHNNGTFSVRSRDGYDMSNHPVVMVRWYGATAFCNYYGYRLPTEWEWQAAADYDGSYTYGCGTTIDQSKANYNDANPLNLTDWPYTTPIDYYPSYGYGIHDMAGNVYEWTSSHSGNYYVMRGGSWLSDAQYCDVSYRFDSVAYMPWSVGFRVCR